MALLCRSTLVLVVVMGVLALFPLPQVVVGQQVTKRVGIVSLYPYQPKAISRLDELPTAISEKLTNHLMARLGASFFSKLRFRYGSVVNFADLYRINPGAREYEWEIFAYRIGFVFSDRRAGVKEYEAEMWLDKQGEIIREIDLPDIKNHPAKEKLISVKDAKRISKLNKFKPQRVELVFRQKDDSIAWRMVRSANDGTTWCLDISAHNGDVLEKFGMKGIHD